MSFVDQIWPHEVVIHKFGSNNFHGEATSTSSRRVRAYIEPSSAVSRQSSDRDTQLGTTIIVDDINVATQDELTLPTGERLVISSVSKYDFWDGLLHSVIVVS